MYKRQLSGHSPTIKDSAEFADGVIGVHGTDQPQLIGCAGLTGVITGGGQPAAVGGVGDRRPCPCRIGDEQVLAGHDDASGRPRRLAGHPTESGPLKLPGQKFGENCLIYI